MRGRGKPSPAAERAKERRDREDASTRLGIEVPRLQSLEMELADYRSGSDSPAVRHVRRWVIGSAPARFEFPCGDPSCMHGGHDITRDVLQSLRAQREHFTGSHPCDGSVGTVPCGRTMKYIATATYAS